MCSLSSNSSSFRIYSDEPEYGPSNYNNAAYRQWTLWRYRYLGRGNRKVIPSRVMQAVCTEYANNYLGFKEYLT